jgi:putative membrane protein
MQVVRAWSEVWFLLASLIVPLLLLGAMAWLVVALRRSSRPRDVGPTGALRVLEERFARGEIDRDEFLERRRVLTGG